jgi:hypothetical protein
MEAARQTVVVLQKACASIGSLMQRQNVMEAASTSVDVSSEIDCRRFKDIAEGNHDTNYCCLSLSLSLTHTRSVSLHPPTLTLPGLAEAAASLTCWYAHALSACSKLRSDADRSIEALREAEANHDAVRQTMALCEDKLDTAGWCVVSGRFKYRSDSLAGRWDPKEAAEALTHICVVLLPVNGCGVLPAW